VLGPVEQEQVADLVQVDLLVEGVVERLERPQAAQAQLDVHRIGELRANTPRRLAGGPGAELALLDEDDIRDPGPGEVVGGAEPDDTATDDDHGGPGRKSCRHLRLTSGRSPGYHDDASLPHPRLHHKRRFVRRFLQGR
jgi:hypothetical protein